MKTNLRLKWVKGGWKKFVRVDPYLQMFVAELVIFSPESFALPYVIIVKQEIKYSWQGDLESLNSFEATLLPPVSCYCGWR